MKNIAKLLDTIVTASRLVGVEPKTIRLSDDLYAEWLTQYGANASLTTNNGVFNSLKTYCSGIDVVKAKRGETIFEVVQK